ncbi:hypothetical protein EDB85DRAFT_2148302 [Lactarius pseudohatsudake]|nr:hypothetical protein EDB85DRAFT_2148302 [Lactarius pseudohatsudake]
MASGLMLSSLARLSSSVVMRHAASAALEQSRRDYIRTPRKVADEDDIVPLVLDAGLRQQVGEEVCRCGTGDKRLVFVLNKTDVRVTDSEAAEDAKVPQEVLEWAHRTASWPRRRSSLTGRRVSEAEPYPFSYSLLLMTTSRHRQLMTLILKDLNTR